MMNVHSEKKRAEILLYFTNLVVAQISAVEDLEQIQSCQRDSLTNLLLLDHSGFSSLKQNILSC